MAEFKLDYTGAQVNQAIANANTMPNLASRVSTLEGKHNWTSTRIDFSNGSSLSLWKSGNICMCELNATTTSAVNAWTVIGTLPEEYRPPWNVMMRNALTGGYDTSIILNSDGAGAIQNAGSAWPSGAPTWYFATWIVNK